MNPEVEEKDCHEIELPNGDVIQIKADDKYLRYIVYDKQIQVVRNVEGFIDYHQKNPGSLQRLITNATWVLLHDEEFINRMYYNCRSNARFPRPYYSTRPKQSMFLIALGGMETIPVSSLVKHTLNWLKGLMISAYGAQGFDMIKEAVEAGKQRRLTEIMLTQSEGSE